MKGLIIFTLFLCISQVHLAQNYRDLEGLWKVEGKPTYESWRWDKEHLVGESYKIIAGQKRIIETLSIKEIGDDIIYAATVPSQNEGATIPFKLDKTIKNQLQFENFNHDFPNIIIYKMISVERFYVEVSGKDNEGFSFYLIRTE